ncbi:hypothetical protein [Nordella sp. HKS 07]|uniref:hypothetical protein n=1 Tax=Nordella sp. HKS 07 TaxID=2712222 RepID=UPI0019D0E37A|nr:hypothetical protein [Nordella sp. HKS 07]
MVGRIQDIVPVTPQIDPNPEAAGRFQIAFSDYAEVDIPHVWEGRNPVRYTTLEELGIDVQKLDFKPMPPSLPPSQGDNQSHHQSERGEQKPLRLTIAEAKQGLSNTYGVPPEAVEITIRG